MAKQNAFGKAIWDRKESTYRHRIIFWASNKELLGYSKKVDHQERHDKIGLLINLILRLLTSGYLDERTTRVDTVDCVEFYYNETDDLIFRLYYGHCEWEANVLANPELKRLVSFIEKFYAMIAAKETPETIYNKLYYRNRDRAVDIFNLDRPRFSSETQLASYCQFIIAKKKSEQGAVEQFFRAYKKKFLTAGNDREALLPGSGDMLNNFTRHTKPPKPDDDEDIDDDKDDDNKPQTS